VNAQLAQNYLIMDMLGRHFAINASQVMFQLTKKLAMLVVLENMQWLQQVLVVAALWGNMSL
jgi:hypothetical protein